MIVSDAPYDLLVVCSDADVQKLLQRFVERGQERKCLRPFRWRCERDALRDGFISRPDSAVLPLLGNVPTGTCKVLLMWDQHGSGRERDDPKTVENEVLARLERGGVARDDMEAMALVPEVEVLLIPAWERVKQYLAGKRSRTVPTDEAIMARARSIQRRKARQVILPKEIRTALSRHPKELFVALVDLLDLRTSPALFEELGTQLSIPQIKSSEQGQRLASRLAGWFPGTGSLVGCEPL